MEATTPTIIIHFTSCTVNGVPGTRQSTVPMTRADADEFTAVADDVGYTGVEWVTVPAA